MESIQTFLFAQREEAQAAKILQLKKSLRHLNVLDQRAHEFIKNFRVSKELFKYLAREMKTHLPSRRADSLSVSTKLACVLHFLAEGGSQEATAKDYRAGIGQSTCCEVLAEFLNFMDDYMCARWIKLKMTDEEDSAARVSFYEKVRFPNTIMAIDGTHIRISAPKEDKHLYLNRKRFYSLNGMVACDHEMTIQYIDSRFAGSNHDPHVWAISGMRTEILRRFQNGSRIHILGDAGYPLAPWLLTPFRSPSSERQTRYNRKHSSGRMVIERTFGVLKNRWRCLIKGLNYCPKKSCQIVNVCAALHNMCLKFSVPVLENVIDENNLSDNMARDDIEHDEIGRREWIEQAQNIKYPQNIIGLKLCNEINIQERFLTPIQKNEKSFPFAKIFID